MDEAAQTRPAEWRGALDRTTYAPALVEESDRLADAAKAADWDTVFRILDGNHRLGANSWRVGGHTWFTPLHQAAWHGADARVVDELVRRGGWKSLRDAAGKRPIDIARERGHEQLSDSLASRDPGAAEAATIRIWDDGLRGLVEDRTKDLQPLALRHVSTEVVALESIDPLWFPIPGMYGGFSISTHKGRLFVESWSRVVGGSGQAHVITAAGWVLVEEGFV